jgi:maltose O-acetyltransferase
VSEFDKMVRGDPYRSMDPQLVDGRVRAQRLTRELGALDPADVVARRRVLRALLGAMGRGSDVMAPFWCDYGSNVSLGARVFVNTGCVFLDPAPITIGDDVLIGPLVQLLTADHPRDLRERVSGVESALPVSIGAGAWLGAGVIVLPGVQIGAGAVVGAGSVVTRSLPAGVTAAGNPCRVVRGGPGG